MRNQTGNWGHGSNSIVKAMSSNPSHITQKKKKDRKKPKPDSRSHFKRGNGRSEGITRGWSKSGYIIYGDVTTKPP
jgi:hypothetical protein